MTDGVDMMNDVITSRPTPGDDSLDHPGRLNNNSQRHREDSMSQSQTTTCQQCSK